jgi:hypothetical protein
MKAVVFDVFARSVALFFLSDLKISSVDYEICAEWSIVRICGCCCFCDSPNPGLSCVVSISRNTAQNNSSKSSNTTQLVASNSTQYRRNNTNDNQQCPPFLSSPQIVASRASNSSSTTTHNNIAAISNTSNSWCSLWHVFVSSFWYM